MKYTKRRIKKLKKKSKKRGGSNTAETSLERDYKSEFTDPTFKNLEENINGNTSEKRADLDEERDDLVFEISDREGYTEPNANAFEDVAQLWILILDYFKKIFLGGREEELKDEYTELKDNINIVLGNSIIEERISDAKDKSEFLRLKDILIDLILKCMFNNYKIYNLLTKLIIKKVDILSDKRKLLLCQNIDEFINNDLLDLSIPKKEPYSGKLNLDDNLYGDNPYILKHIAEFIGPPIPLRLENGNIVDFTNIDYVKLILTLKAELLPHEHDQFSEIKNKLNYFIDLIRKASEQFEIKMYRIGRADTMLAALKKQYRESVVDCLGKMREKILDNIDKIAINTKNHNKFDLEEGYNTLENNIEELQNVQAFEIDPDGFLIEGRDDQWPEGEEPSDLYIFINMLGFEKAYSQSLNSEYVREHLLSDYIPFNLLRPESTLMKFRDWYLGEIEDDDIELYSEW
ncbi:hypothetical protein N9O88_01350 [bacterium]|nr:hypothetical protein [bacterium]